jgi:hypothetical protein
MPDLLAHAFIAYAVCRVLSWRVEWLTTQYVTVGMVGALIPDITKIYLLFPNHVMERLLGMPFSWYSLGSGGGVVISVLVGVVLAASDVRRHVAVVLGIGAGSHLFADSLLLTPTGYSTQLLWPLSQARTPSPGLYLSTQPEPMIAAGLVAIGVWSVHARYFAGSAPKHR